VTRLVRFGARFRLAAERLSAMPGSARGRAVARVIVELAGAENLPGLGDTRALIPPTGEAYVRRVPGRNLWIWYVVEDAALAIRHLGSEPPVPLDEEE
jgi:hypothetical protein